MRTVKVEVTTQEQTTCAASRDQRVCVLNSNNSVLAEFATEAEAADYLKTLNPQNLPAWQRSAPYRASRGWNMGGFRVLFARRDESGHFMPVRVVLETAELCVAPDPESKWFPTFSEALTFAQTL